MESSYTKKIIVQGDLFVITKNGVGVQVYRYPASPLQSPSIVSFGECPAKVQQALIDYDHSSKPIPNNKPSNETRYYR